MKLLLVTILSFLFLNSKAINKNDSIPWKYLFNGKDFANWKLVGSLGVSSIVDDAFYCHMTSNTKEHTFITTKEKFSDFILELDVNVDSGYNTGILIRSIDKPADCDTCRVSLYGYQVKVDPSPTRRWSGGVFDDFGSTWSWLYDLSKDVMAQKSYSIGKWNHFRIEAIGHSIRVWVNGTPTTHLIHQKYTLGYIALKIHSLGNFPAEEKKIGRFKNIRIITDNLNKYIKQMDLPAKSE